MVRLEGQLRFTLDAEISAAETGSFVFVPRGVAHCFQNIGNDPARVLVLFTPSGMEGFFDRFADVPRGSATQDAFRRIGSEGGMDVIGPSLAQSHPLPGR